MNVLKWAAVAAVLLAASGCVNRAAQEQNKKTQEVLGAPEMPVEVVSARPSTVPEIIEVTGQIAVEDDAVIGAQVQGRLTATYVQDGDIVQAGQIIADQERMDDEARLRAAKAQVDSARAQLQQALREAAAAPARSAASVRAAEARARQAQETVGKLRAGLREQERRQASIAVERAQSDLNTAKTALDRARRLFNEGALAKADVEAAENRHDNALAAYKSALEGKSLADAGPREEDIRIAMQELSAAQEAVRIERTQKGLDANFEERVNGARAQVRAAEEQVKLVMKALYNASIRAPFRGRISGRPAQPGTVLGPGSPVARIVSTDRLYFEPQVTERQVTKLKPGTGVSLSLDALDGAKFSGVVEGVNPLASNVARLYTVRVRISESDPAIKPGMFAKGEILAGQRDGVYVLPDEAVFRDGDKAWVMVVEQGKAQRRSIQIQRAAGNRYEATGLRPGDQVIVKGQAGLLAETPVKIEKPETGAAEAP